MQVRGVFERLDVSGREPMTPKVSQAVSQTLPAARLLGAAFPPGASSSPRASEAKEAKKG